MKIVNYPFSSSLALAILIFSASPTSEAANAFRDCSECPEMVEIRKGSFLMGSDIGRDDEMPMHQVTIDYNFAVSRYEITRAQYASFIKDTNASPDPGCEVYDLPSFNMDLEKSWLDPAFSQDDDHPVVCVNWRDAQSYVNWLSRMTSGHYRLLSESEWEYVARAGSTTAYHFGDDIDPGKANYDDEFRKTTAVGSYPGNAFGLHDMHGNVSEWVEDCWVDNYRQAPVNGAAMTEGPCESRVLRGGTWDNEPQYLRSAFRHGYFAEFRLSGIGFRIAKLL